MSCVGQRACHRTDFHHALALFDGYMLSAAERLRTGGERGNGHRHPAAQLAWFMTPGWKYLPDLRPAL